MSGFGLVLVCSVPAVMIQGSNARSGTVLRGVNQSLAPRCPERPTYNCTQITETNALTCFSMNNAGSSKRFFQNGKRHALVGTSGQAGPGDRPTSLTSPYALRRRLSRVHMSGAAPASARLMDLAIGLSASVSSRRASTNADERSHRSQSCSMGTGLGSVTKELTKYRGQSLNAYGCRWICAYCLYIA